MTKVVVFSDLHAHNWGPFAQPLSTGRNSRLQVTLDVLDQIKTFCQEHEVSHCFMLGDVFHSRTKVDVDVFSSTYLAFKAISEVVEHFVVLRGNHDSYDRDGGRHSLSAFKEFCHVVETPEILGLGELQVAAHPFTTQIEDWIDFTTILADDLDFFLFHQGVTNGLVGAFNIALKAEIDVNDVPTTKAKWCLAGHYHKHQYMGDNLLFVGSPLQHSFNERTEDKGFLFFDGLQDPPKQIPTAAPVFRLFESEDTLVQEMRGGFDPSKNYVQLKCPSSRVDYYAHKFPMIDVTPVAESQPERQRLKDEVLGDDRELLKAYMSEKGTGTLEVRDLIEIGLAALQED